MREPSEPRCLKPAATSPKNLKKRKLEKMWDFLFVDDETGELFFVECDTLLHAWDTIKDTFEDFSSIRFLNKFSVEDAEILGYDTY